MTILYYAIYRDDGLPRPVYMFFCPSFSKEGGPLAVGDFFRLKILRLYEPPPLSKGGQKEMQSYVGTRFFVSFFCSPLFAPVRGNVTIVTKGVYDNGIFLFFFKPLSLRQLPLKGEHKMIIKYKILKFNGTSPTPPY